MVNIYINGKSLSVPSGYTIMQAAATIGIEIPKLCYLKDINEIAACRVCVVEVEGLDRLITSCNNVVEEGMVISTNSHKVRLNRRKTVELLLSQHDFRCATCVRSKNCSLQNIANDLNILDLPFKDIQNDTKWNQNFPLIRDSKKCIQCMRCIQICDKVQGLGVWELESTGSRSNVQVSHNRKIEDSDCTLCGQCITHCPVGALRERDDTLEAWNAIDDKSKTVIVQVAPAVRAAFGETLGLSREEATMGKIADALKKIGFDYVFDTTFTADLTIMEEGTEFVHKFVSGETKDLPMFTSCCPGWMRYVKAQYPRLLPNVSTAKSPQQMFGAVMKTFFAEKIGVNPNDIVTVSVMPCVAKKSERERELFHEEYAGHDVDIVLTTREFCRMIKVANISAGTLADIECDAVMKEASGAGVIFGATGGVMEAALRSAHFLVTGKNPTADQFSGVRSQSSVNGVVEAEVTIGDAKIAAAVVSGLANTRKLINSILRGEVRYDFVEVMACPGGCVGGGGQPIHDGMELAYTRGANLYQLDKNSKIRFSHENKDVLKMYEEYFEKPNSHKAHMLLHTDHTSWSMPKPVRR